MTDQERINENLQRQIDAQNARIDNVLTKVDMMIGEMRDRDNQRAEDIRELRQDMKDMQKSFYAKMDNTDLKIDSMGKQIQNLTIAAVVGFGAIAAAVGGLVFAAFR